LKIQKFYLVFLSKQLLFQIPPESSSTRSKTRI
jgi:hypothetical protein